MARPLRQHQMTVATNAADMAACRLSELAPDAEEILVHLEEVLDKVESGGRVVPALAPHAA